MSKIFSNFATGKTLPIGFGIGFCPFETPKQKG